MQVTQNTVRHTMATESSLMPPLPAAAVPAEMPE
jgi:hypothetical protein